MRIIRLPLPYYGPADDKGSEAPEKTPAQLERENIKVISSNDKVEEKEEVKEEAKDADEEAEVEEENDDENDEEVKEEVKEEKELTAEQKENETLKKKLERAQRRAGKTASERDENKKLVKDLKAQLDAKLAEGTQPLTEEEVERRANEKAINTLNEREYKKAEENLIDAAIKIDKTFMSKVNDLAAEVAPLPGFFVGALNNLDHENGGAVLNYLTDNPDEYEEILKKNDPTRIITKLIRISDKLHEASKPKPKKISNAPEPAKAPKGNGKNPDTLPSKPTDNMAEYIRVRGLQDKAKREARGE